MTRISRNAKSRGMTPEILEDVLGENQTHTIKAFAVRLVFDTNIIISALLFEASKPFQAFLIGLEQR